MHVESLHRKGAVDGERGLPKPAVPEILILQTGVDGDFNRYRHESRGDDPEQAVLLHAAEELEQLVAEGWPVRASDLGENVLTRGLPYPSLAPGMRIRVGGAALVITKAAKPCKNLAVLPYVGQERLNAWVRTLRDRRGWYARVVEEGKVAVGDTVEADVPEPLALSEQLELPGTRS